MTDPTIAFLRQPLEALARGGETVAGRLVRMLGEWVHSNRTAHVASQLVNRLYVLAAPDVPWRIVLIPREGRDTGSGGWIEVCAVVNAAAPDLVAHFSPLTKLDHLAATMEVKLMNLDPAVFSLVVESIGPNSLMQPPDSAMSGKWQILEGSDNSAIRLLEIFDSTADRWASSKARSQFKSVLDGALERPQVVEREADDLVIVSRRYLQEAIDPTSAKGLSQRYLAMGLSDDDMPVLVHGSLPPLEDLPETRLP